MTGSSAHTGSEACKKIICNADTEQPQINGLRVQHLTTDIEFDALQDAWLRLHRDCDTTGLFNGWYWNRLWWQYYGDRGELFIVTVCVDDVIHGIAPFYRRQTRALGLRDVTTLRLIGSGEDTSPDDLGLLHSRGFEQLVATCVCEYIFNSSVCARIHLTDLPEHSNLVATLFETARKYGWKYPAVRLNHRRVDTLPTSVDTFEKNLSRNARKQRKRRRKQLLNTGKNVEFKRCLNEAQIEPTFMELLRVHNLRHAGKGGSDSFKTEKYRGFHLAVMKAALENNELRLMHLTVDGKTIGIEYAFLCKGILSFFQTGFDPDFQHISPGHLLMMETIDRAIEDGARGVDLLKGDYKYKHSYAGQTKTSVDLDLWKNPVIATIKLVIHWIRMKGGQPLPTELRPTRETRSRLKAR